MSVLHTPEDVQSGKVSEMMETARREGKWEGVLNRVRKNKQHFTAKVAITPRCTATGQPVSFLVIC